MWDVSPVGFAPLTLNVMPKSIIITLCLLALSGCGTTMIYSAKSEGDIDELYATCVGPIGLSYINHNGEPFLFISVEKEEGSTTVYLSKHHEYEQQKVTYPASAILLIEGQKVKALREDSTSKGKKVPDAVHYKYTKELKSFTFDIGSVLLNKNAIKIEPIEFTYEERRFLMCLQ